MKIMVVGAHALDAELTAGASILKWNKKGHKAMFVHMTRGERGHKFKTPEEFAPQLDKEIVEVANNFDADVKWMGYKGGFFPEFNIGVKEMVELIREYKPNVVITHWRGSLHDRHIATHDIVTRAVDMSNSERFECNGEPHQVSLLMYGENCEDLKGFNPNFYVNINDHIEDAIEKIKGYELFSGGWASVPYEDYYRTMARVRGLEHKRYPKAQSFMIDNVNEKNFELISKLNIEE